MHREILLKCSIRLIYFFSPILQMSPGKQTEVGRDMEQLGGTARGGEGQTQQQGEVGRDRERWGGTGRGGEGQGEVESNED